MFNFYVGQKVVCIDDSSPISESPDTPVLVPLIKNQIYIILNIKPFPLWSRHKGEIALAVNKIDGYREYWRASRFKPLEEKKTDISIFTEMLAPNKILEKV